MTLDVDISAPIRSLARKRELIVAIYSSPASEQETDWLEWKSVVDLTAKRWRVELSRQTLGMANRDPDVVAKWAGGCGFIIVGVSPGSLDGTPVHDNAWSSPSSRPNSASQRGHAARPIHRIETRVRIRSGLCATARSTFATRQRPRKRAATTSRCCLGGLPEAARGSVGSR